MKAVLVLVALLLAPVAHAQSALGWASQGMTKQPDRYNSGHKVIQARIDRRFMRSVARSESMLVGIVSPLAAKSRATVAPS